MRAWIEIIVGRNEFHVACAALLVRAWIEMGKTYLYSCSLKAALLVRAWIEIVWPYVSELSGRCRSPRESVD